MGEAEKQEPNTPVIQVFQDSGGKWRWHLVGGNGEVIAQGEGHRDQHDAIRAVERVETVFRNDPDVVIRRHSTEV